MQTLFNLFRRQRTDSPLSPERIPSTFNLAARGWGHDYTILSVDEGGTIKMAGWHPKRFAVGDFLILANGTGTTRYRVTEVDWKQDPQDMFFATAEFAPRGDHG